MSIILDANRAVLAAALCITEGREADIEATIDGHNDTMLLTAALVQLGAAYHAAGLMMGMSGAELLRQEIRTLALQAVQHG